ncbi:hypothetical protein DESUT3_26090 [Desulfuromonas versatilis]|uniref:Response regulatory domain-containing protein n=1 Tax=Desulfuromonas versatilis TaxID=2802975 RepID=A0ABM8HXL0_9BACT|nr:response regulator [Desulfuromonas versatilis]BCR05540.1 hypothetical protein DESUT3_26090 [Desulfuromonas versatilis]
MKNIFIVDDQPDIRQLLEIALKGDGRRLHLLDSGEDALRRAEDISPDLILLDVMMPGGMDGYETVRRLKGNLGTRHCPVIVVTARGQAVDRADALACGADEYVSKPFSIAEIKRTVSGYLC